MNAELIMIGSELLLGQIVDTNSTFLAQELNAIGASVLYKCTVGDNRARMREALARAFERSDITITSGGLGPTEDDLTREVIADVAGVELEFRQDLYDYIKNLFESHGFTMTENNRKQAFVPAGADVIHNPQGTAPAFCVTNAAGHAIYALPGVQRELRWLTEHEVIPRIQAKLGGGIIKSRSLRICGLGESRVDSQVGDLLREASNPTLGILAQEFMTVLRITARGNNEAEADGLIGAMEGDLRQRFGKLVFGVDDDTIESVVSDLLTQYDATLAVAETVTGGSIARRLVSAGRTCFVGGAVLPNADAIRRYLEAEPPTELQAQAAALARRAVEMTGAAVGLGVAGEIAAGSSASDGSVFGSGKTAVALAMPDDEPQTWEFPMGGLSQARQDRVAVLALEMVRRTLVGAPMPS